MSDISVRHFQDMDLTVLVVRGPLSASDIVHHASHSYTTNRVLWDLRAASAERLSPEEYETLPQFMRTLSIPRARGKTALLGDKSNPDFDVLHMYKKLVESTSLPVEYQVFSSIEEAKRWLGVTV